MALAGAIAVELFRFEDLGPSGRIVVTVVAFGAFGALFLPPVRRHALTTRRVPVVAAVLVAIALIAPPAGSHDIWSYAVYGRLVSVHHVSPFTHVPADFSRDPLFHLVARGWRHTGSVYGPGFVALSGLGTAMTGSSELATRVFFQLLEAAALGAVLLIVWRRTRDPVALAFIGLNPAMIVVVNGGHNDIVVGLTVLAGTLLLLDDHPRLGALAFAAGALVKLVVALPLGALLLWQWRRRGLRTSLATGATATVVVLVAYLASGGGEALGPLLHAGKQHSRSSIWQVATQWLASPLGIARSALFTIEGGAALALIATVGVLVTLLLTRPVVARASSDLSTAAIVAGAAVLVFLLAGAYILPWYSAWALPVLALVRHSRVAMLAAGQAALISVAYAAPLTFGPLLSTYAQDVLPLLLLGALAYLIWSACDGRLALPIGSRRSFESSPVPAQDPGLVP